MAGFERQDSGGITFSPQQAQRQQSKKRRAFGFMKALIESNHLVKHPVDEKVRQHIVRDLSLFPKAKMRLLCLTCCKFYADAAALNGEPRHNQKAMDKATEAHVLAFWSDDYPDDYLAEFEELKENHRVAQEEENEKGKKGRKLKPPSLDLAKCIGLLSDQLPPR